MLIQTTHILKIHECLICNVHTVIIFINTQTHTILRLQILAPVFFKLSLQLVSENRLLMGHQQSGGHDIRGPRHTNDCQYDDHCSPQCKANHCVLPVQKLTKLELTDVERQEGKELTR